MNEKKKNNNNKIEIEKARSSREIPFETDNAHKYKSVQDAEFIIKF